MSIKQALVIAAICAAVAVGTEFYGRQFFLWYLVLIGLTGFVGTLLYARRQARIARAVSELDESAQDDVLVAIEESPERPAIADAVDRSHPIVPIRGGREVFRYPSEYVTVARWLSRACLFLSGFFALGWASDTILGTTHFADPAVTPWWETVLLIAGFAVAGLLMSRATEATEGELEINEEGIVYRHGERVSREIAWDALTEAGTSPLVDRLWVRAGRKKIAVSSGLVGFGRVVNLVASRASARSRWRAG